MQSEKVQIKETPCSLSNTICSVIASQCIWLYYPILIQHGTLSSASTSWKLPWTFWFFFILQVLSQHQHPLIFHMKIADGGLLKNKDCCHEALILYVIMNLSTVIDTLASFFLYLYLLHFLFHFIYSMVQYRCCIIVIEVTPEHRRLFKISWPSRARAGWGE